ncbi:MAG: META domain-containing protein [Xanthomonadales bacterium]|nr:META domain-containing protein [Xanthomonadales bacterium]
MRIAALLFPLFLAACASAPPATAPVRTPATAEPEATLTRYHWRLQQATDASGAPIVDLFARPAQPLQLDFMDGRVSISNACNRIGGPYTLSGGRLRTGQLVSTKMACADPAVSALDAAIGRRLDDTMVSMERQTAAPVLTLMTRNGDVLRFVGDATAAVRYGGPGDEMFLEVAPEPVPCADGVPACLSVREVHYDPQGLPTGAPGAWQYLPPAAIEGYVHQRGVRNVLRVIRYRNPGHPDTYLLDMVVEAAMRP